MRVRAGFDGGGGGRSIQCFFCYSLAPPQIVQVKTNPLLDPPTARRWMRNKDREGHWREERTEKSLTDSPLLFVKMKSVRKKEIARQRHRYKKFFVHGHYLKLSLSLTLLPSLFFPIPLVFTTHTHYLFLSLSI